MQLSMRALVPVLDAVGHDAEGESVSVAAVAIGSDAVVGLDGSDEGCGHWKDCLRSDTKRRRYALRVLRRASVAQSALIAAELSMKAAWQVSGVRSRPAGTRPRPREAGKRCWRGLRGIRYNSRVAIVTTDCLE